MGLLVTVSATFDSCSEAIGPVPILIEVMRTVAAEPPVPVRDRAAPVVPVKPPRLMLPAVNRSIAAPPRATEGRCKTALTDGPTSDGRAAPSPGAAARGGSDRYGQSVNPPAVAPKGVLGPFSAGRPLPP